jgi:cobalt-precorrin-5B (C1)-methyltransferase
VVLSTGGKSERFARRLLGNLAEESFVQIADFYGFSLEAAARLGFDKVTHSVFIGKLVKMAMGLQCTHASSGNMDLGILTDIAREVGGPKEIIDELANANTARHALELMQETKTVDRIIPPLSARAIEVSRSHSQGKLDIHLFLFDYSGEVVYRS